MVRLSTGWRRSAMRNTTLARRAAAVTIVAALGAVLSAGPSLGQPARFSAATNQDNKVMTAAQPLSAKQQAIPLIACFMARSEMRKLNAALNQGLDAGLTIS